MHSFSHMYILNGEKTPTYIHADKFINLHIHAYIYIYIHTYVCVYIYVYIGEKTLGNLKDEKAPRH